MPEGLSNMSIFLENIGNILGISDMTFCALATLASILFTYGIGLVAVRKLPFESITLSGEGVGSFCNVVGVLYAIVLGYVLVSVYETYTTANDKVEAEASFVIDLLRDAEGLPLHQGLMLRTSTIAYLNSVIDEEWPYMIKNRTFFPGTFHKFSDLFKTVRLIKCDTEEERLFLGEIVTRLNDLASTRRERIQVADSRIPNVFWSLLIGVGLVNFGMSFLFPIESPKIRLALLCSTAAVMTFTTLLIYVLDRPYNGTLGIQPDSMIKVRNLIVQNGIDQHWKNKLIEEVKPQPALDQPIGKVKVLD